MRFVTPLLFLAAAFYVRHNNATDPNHVLVLPGIDMLAPGTADDPAGQGQATVTALFTLAGLFFVWNLWRGQRATSE